MWLHFDHCSSRTVRGLNLLNALYSSNGVSILVVFELMTKPIQYSDLAINKLKRKSDKTQNEMMRKMIQTCIQNSLKFFFVLMGRWFSSEEGASPCIGREYPPTGRQRSWGRCVQSRY